MNKNIPAKEAKDNKYETVMKMFNIGKELLDSDREETKPIDEISKKWNMNEKILELFTKNIEKDQKLKERYAIILIVILSIQLLALIVIFILKGRNILNYSDSTFNIFVSGGIAEVFVLVRVIVKYLFKDNLTNALNIILENNNKTKYKAKYKSNKDINKTK